MIRSRNPFRLADAPFRHNHVQLSTETASMIYSITLQKVKKTDPP